MRLQKAQVSEVETALVSSQRSYENSENELLLLRSKYADVESQLQIARKEKNAMEEQNLIALDNLQSLEDKALQAARDRSSWERQMETLGEQLETEINKRVHLEKSAKTVKSENETLQMKIVEQDQYIKGLRRELQDKEAELAKSVSLQDKTIVEHVHVLEEAKRYTDKQLSECVCNPFLLLLIFWQLMLSARVVT